MIDWHCHILPGLDDGPETMAESLDMARLLAAAGFVTVHCTPHCIPGRYENIPSLVRRATERLQRELLQAGIRLAVKPGMEYYLDEQFPSRLESPLRLGDTPFLLVEIPSRASAELIRENLLHVIRCGYVPLIAHPERCALLNPTGYGGLLKPLHHLGAVMGRGNREKVPPQGAVLLSEFLTMGCRFQGNLSSFAGYYGRGPRQQALHHLQNGLYSHFGSDGHSFLFLDNTLTQGLAVLGNCSLNHSSGGTETLPGCSRTRQSPQPTSHSPVGEKAMPSQ